MGCLGFRSSNKRPTTMKPSTMNDHQPKNISQQTLLQIPQCKVHLMDDGEALELAEGEFMLTRIYDEDVSIAIIVRVGNDLTWPLTKDEPVVRLDSLSYLFSLPMKDGHPLSYGVTFHEQCGANSLSSLDQALRDNSCFSGLAEKTSNNNNNFSGVDWKEFAPRVEDYNNVLARAIAGGTGHIVKGIFKCSNAYANQVHKGGQMTLSRGVEEKVGVTKHVNDINNSNSGSSTNKKSSGLNKSLKRVRKLSKMTEKLSKTMLDGVGIATGAVMAPMMKSQTGKAFIAMVPGEVLLASLDAVNKILDAAEIAEKQALSATSMAATRMVSNRFGENAGEATSDVLATAGHCAGTAWNIFKIRKALNPTSSVSTGVLKNAAKNSIKR